MAVVSKNSEIGIINQKGEVVVDFGEYADILPINNLYLAQKTDEHQYLLDSNGKVVYDLAQGQVSDFSTKGRTLIILDDTGYKIINHKGKIIYQVPKESATEVYSTSNDYDYVAIHYNNENHVIDINTGKELASFEEENVYCIDHISKDKKIIILNACTYRKTGNYSLNENHVRFIVNGQVKNMDSQCESFVVDYNKNLICRKDNEEYLIDDDYNIGISTENRAYIDNNSYAENVYDRTTSKHSVNFYSNGKIAKTVPCRKLVTTNYVNDIYRLVTDTSRTCNETSEKYEYYTDKGEKIFQTSYADAAEFDSAGNAVVSDGDGKSYLINSKGKKISEKYDLIKFIEEAGYRIMNDNKYGVLKKNGKVKAKPIYQNIKYFQAANKIYYLVINDSSEYIVYNERMKQILKSSSLIDYTDSFLITNENNTIKYYTMTGKKFYEKSAYSQ